MIATFVGAWGLGCVEPEADAPKPGISVSCAPTANALRFACHVSVEPPQAIALVAAPVDGVGFAPTFAPAEARAEHDLTVWFLARDRAYTITATAADGATARTEITTDHAPGEVQTWMKVVGASTVPLIGSQNPCAVDARAVIYDTATGDVVWYEDLDPAGHFGLSDMVRFTDERTVIGETSGKLVEVGLDGTILRSFADGVDFSGNLHHDFFAEPDRLWVLGKDATSGTAPLQLDWMTVIDRRTGIELARWQSWDHLPVPKDAVGNYFHINSVWLDGAGGLYFSMWELAALVKIDGRLDAPTFGEVEWTMIGSADGSDLEQDFQLDWSAIGGADDFARQHALSVRADGRLMLFDNPSSRALILSVDEANRRVVVDASFAAEETICDGQGTAAETPTGNVMVACTTRSVREYDLATREIVWSGEARCANGNVAAAVRWYPLDWR